MQLNVKYAAVAYLHKTVMPKLLAAVCVCVTTMNQTDRHKLLA